MLFLMLLFCVDCRIWNLYKVNYVFIFEFDTRHHLDWRELVEVIYTGNTFEDRSLTDEIAAMPLPSSSRTISMVQLHQFW
jgi:hypothetical protein